MNYTFTTVITQEKNWYVAYCVELGVTSQGKTIENAQKKLREAVELYLEDQPKTCRFAGRHASFVSTMQVSHV